MTTTRVSDEPAFGYGRHRRPLRTRRDRDAETVRDVLRRAGHREYGRPRDGFCVIDGGDGGLPFIVACASRTRRRTLSPTAELAAYRRTLTAAGLRVEPAGAGDDPTYLKVWLA
ncbi:hypothetical protein AB0L25_01685 [Spirillospora sp. NPDC052242]